VWWIGHVFRFGVLCWKALSNYAEKSGIVKSEDVNFIQGFITSYCKDLNVSNKRRVVTTTISGTITDISKLFSTLIHIG